ncbi:hypothetical protein [Acinetobacter sp. ANC 4173]|uniref:hypothetical protein n=1 Tax=Acinetobacter sp. ANC 4173 TaxID=2529837 RepID=UPI00103AE4C0|nr:hypothetical protein [Acinetobacter sp. ANC 4173]TCB79855.1 hypothetical protein E0H94_08495 [Acinetobacter sp. ANC 4173]
MKKLLRPLVIAVLAIPTLAMANTPATTTVAKVQAAQGATTASATVHDTNVTVMSPRTGIKYAFPNPQQRPIILKTAAVSAATTATATRIVATNPALSVESQEQAKQTLVGSSTQLAAN